MQESRSRGDLELSRGSFLEVEPRYSERFCDVCDEELRFFDWRKELREGVTVDEEVEPDAAAIASERRRSRDASTTAAQISECHLEGSKLAPEMNLTRSSFSYAK